jgi:hypothetical protein
MTPPRAGSASVRSGSPFEQPACHPSRIRLVPPGFGRGDVLVPVLGPQGGDDQMAFVIKQIGQPGQRRGPAIDVGVLAELT